MSIILRLLPGAIMFPVLFLGAIFFVLLAIGKTQSKNLKIFGIVVSTLAGILVVLQLFAGIFSIVESYPLIKQQQQMMKARASQQQAPVAPR